MFKHRSYLQNKSESAIGTFKQILDEVTPDWNEHQEQLRRFGLRYEPAVVHAEIRTLVIVDRPKSQEGLLLQPKK